MVHRLEVGRSAERLNPMKFALWVSLASITMMFAGLMSAYIVRQAAGNWLEFALPSHFVLSTGLLVLSSVTMHLSLIRFRQTREVAYKTFLVTTAVLGLTFVCLQYYGWQFLFTQGIDFKGNPSGPFFYIISGLHVAHVLAGLAALAVALFHGFHLPFRVTDKRVDRLEITTQYWHYVDVLWVILYLFLIYYR